MNKIFLIFSLMKLCIKTEADWGYPEIEDAVVLNPSNHEEFIKAYDEVLVYYYLPGCKYCVLMDKFFHKLAFEYKEREQRIPFATFNCNRHISFCTNQAIPTFPFVKFYIRGHPITYFGNRTKIDIDNFIQKIMKSSPKKIDFNEMQSNLVHFVRDKPLLFFVGKESSNLFHIFDLASKYHGEINFYHIENLTLDQVKEMQMFDNNEIVEKNFKNSIFSVINAQGVVFKGVQSFDNLDNFIYKLKHPDLLEFGQNYQDMISLEPSHFMVLFVNSINDEVIKEFERFAKDHKRKINFLIANADTYYPKMYTDLKEALLIEDSDIPCVRIFATSFSLRNIEKYKIPGELGYNTYQELLRTFRSNSIHPYLKVEVLENGEMMGNLKILNSYSFQDNILVSGQDSLLLYHSDLERHDPSKKMFELINKLSTQGNYKDMKFFSINADKNEMKSFYHHQKPVVLLYSKRNLLSPLLYDKEPDLKELKKFIKSKKDVKKNNFGKGSFLDTDL